jgi:predicted transcriptional regulator
MFDHYQYELIRLGLFREREADPKRRYVEITTLGRLLLEAIGRGNSAPAQP